MAHCDCSEPYFLNSLLLQLITFLSFNEVIIEVCYIYYSFLIALPDQIFICSQACNFNLSIISC